MKITVKIISFFIVLLLMAALSVTLYAEEATVTATAIATNSPIYTVVVPQEITSSEDLQRTETTSYHEEAFTVNVTEALFLEGKQITVRVWGESGTFVLKNADGSSTLPYEVFSDAEVNALQNGDVFASFTAIGSQSGFIRIDQKNIKQSDIYTGNLRFSFALEDINE